MNNKLAKHIEELEVLLLQPEVRKSVKRIDELLADDFVEIGMFGKKYFKKDILELLPSSEGDKYEASEFDFRKISGDTVLITYKATLNNLTTNEKIRTMRCSIWQKRNDNWQMIFHQGTVIK